MKLFQPEIPTLIMEELPLGETIPDYRSSLEISIRYYYLPLKGMCMLNKIRKVGDSGKRADTWKWDIGFYVTPWFGWRARYVS